MTPERYQRLRRILARRQWDLTVLMDRVHKPHNLAAVMRSADAVGIGHVHIVPEPDYDAGYHTSMGAARYVRVQRHPSLDEALVDLRGRDLTIVAAHPAPDSVDFRDLDYTRPTALLVGTELDGLTEEAVAAADYRVAVPMHGAVASLNVSVAAAIILYQAERQRADAGMYDIEPEETEEHRRLLFEWCHPRVADLCRRRGAPYPALDEEGQIAGEVPR